MTGYYLVIALLFFSIVYCFQLYFSNKLYLKFLSATVAFFISSSIYFTFDSYKGWPSHETLSKGRLIFAQVESPYKDNKGAIYILVKHNDRDRTWIERVFRYQDNAPRLYQMPFSAKLEDRIKKSIKKMQEGYIVEIDGFEEEGDGESKKSGAESDQKGTSSRESSDVDYRVPHFKIIEPREVLRK